MAAECESGAQPRQLEEKAQWEYSQRVRERVSNLMGQYLLKGYRMLSTTCAECESILLQSRDGSDYCVYCSEVLKDMVSTSERDGVSKVTTMGAGASPQAITHTSSPPFSVTTFPSSSKTPLSKTSSVGSGGGAAHRVPTVWSGQTRDTTKLTTTPADHDTLKMCTDTKCTGMRTNPAIIQLSGLPSTPPPERPTKGTSDVPPSPAKVASTFSSIALPQTVGHSEPGLQCQAALISKLKWCTSELEKAQSLEHYILLCRLITAAGEALKTMQEVPLLLTPPTDHSGDT